MSAADGIFPVSHGGNIRIHRFANNAADISGSEEILTLLDMTADISIIQDLTKPAVLRYPIAVIGTAGSGDAADIRSLHCYCFSLRWGLIGMICIVFCRIDFCMYIAMVFCMLYRRTFHIPHDAADVIGPGHV